MLPGNRISSELITSYINVDSSQRNKQSASVYGKDLLSPPAFPLQFKHGSSMIQINISNHNLKKNDRISLNNVVSKNTILQNVVGVKKNSSFIRIHHIRHGLSLHGLYNPNNPSEFIAVDYVGDLPQAFQESSNIPDNKQYYILAKNANLDFSLTLAYTNSEAMIGNIPTNYLNQKHTVYLIFHNNNNVYEYDPDNYLIKLMKQSSVNYHDSLNTVYNKIHIRYNNLFGVPLSYIINVPFSIIDATNNSLIIDSTYPAIIDPNNSFHEDTKMLTKGGGDQVFIRKISETNPGYPDPNSYTYPLDRIYKNVICAKIISSSFPNSQRVINKSNNKIYWRNLDDGNHIYQISITPGNYTTTQLKNAIQKEFSKTNHDIKISICEATDTVTFSFWKKISLCDSENEKILTIPYDIVQTDAPPGSYIYTEKSLYRTIGNIAKRNITTAILFNFLRNQNDDDYIQEIRSINTATLFKDYIYDANTHTLTKSGHHLNEGDLIITDQLDKDTTTYEIIKIINQNSFIIEVSNTQFITDANITAIPSQQTSLIVYHPNHQLNASDIVTITNSASINSVPSNIINKKHIINHIIDANNYEISLPKFVAIPQTMNQSQTVSISYPGIFQLLFDQPNSLGYLLGFSNVQTAYSHVIKNSDVNPIRKLNLTGQSYFYICCEELAMAYHNTKPVSNVFAIGRWCDDPGTIVFDSIVPATHVYNPPLTSLSELHFTITHPDGSLIEFNGLDHQFVIEITEARAQIS